MSNPKTYDGLYFGLSDEEYHAVPALSASGIKRLLVSPMDFWVDSWLNPDRVEETTDAMILGKAWHKYVLEGAEAFDVEYCALPQVGDYDDVLVSSDDLKQYCRDHGLKISGNKPELIERIHDHDPSAMIWDLLVEEEVSGRIALSQPEVQAISDSALVMRNMPQIKDAFTDGYPEVSYFWTTEHGVPMKIRIDFLKTQAIVDLKTFSNSSGKPVAEAVFSDIGYYRYHVQTVVYFKGIEHAKERANKGQLPVYGDESLKDGFLDAMLGHDRPHRFFFIFQQSDIPNVVAVEMTRFETFQGMGGQANQYWRVGEIAMERGIRMFKDFSGRFAPGIPWLEPAQMITMSDAHFPIYALENTYV